MGTLAPDSDEARRINAALKEWRQGDVALEESWFIHVGDSASPLSEAAAQADGDIQALQTEVSGLVVLTQTCDIVRDCTVRPYIEAAPLVLVSEEDLHAIQRGRRPAHATLPALEPRLLVVDLDRVMTVEKSLVAGWTRTPGYTDDADGRAFAGALARKRVRFAFPDDFNQLTKKLLQRLIDKHDKETDEGRGLRALRELRVLAAPSWNAARVEIWFWFVRNEADADFAGKSWAELAQDWLKLIPATGRFVRVEGQVVTLGDLTAQDYIDSDPLDLDHLSGSR